MGWFNRNSEVLQGVGALATALAAITALIVVPWQIAAAERIQRDQTAREIYREFLNLTIQKPELAVGGLCAGGTAATRAAYAAYVDYLLYTSEQVLELGEGWPETVAAHLAPHGEYLCALGEADLATFSDRVGALVRDSRGACAAANPCDE